MSIAFHDTCLIFLAARRIESVYSRNGDVRSSIPLPPYHAMNDPHLYEYFERRFGQIQTAARRVSFDYRNMNYLLFFKD